MKNRSHLRHCQWMLSGTVLACLLFTLAPAWAERNAGSRKMLDLEELRKEIEWTRENVKPEPITFTQTPEMTKEEEEWAKREARRLSKLEISPKQYYSLPPDQKKIVEREANQKKLKEAAEQKARVYRDGAVDYTLGSGGEPNTPQRAMGATGIIGIVPKEEPRKQILVKSVIPGSPAREKDAALMEGTIRPFDVILGIVSPKVPGLAANGDFTGEAHRVLALAISNAEKAENGGELVLKVWRPKTEYWVAPSAKRPVKTLRVAPELDAKRLNVTLNLRVMGSFSSTSPWNCEKTEKMIKLAAESIAKDGFLEDNISAKEAEKLENQSNEYREDVQAWLDALGLLATGNKKYHPQLRDLAHSQLESSKKANKKADSFYKADLGNIGGTWVTAYKLLFLTEYHLATQDKDIIPVIEGFARYLAMGVSGVGTWSHHMAAVHIDGLYGPPSAYGAMNQVSEVAAMSLLLAQKCGVKDRYVDKAVALALDFYPYYVDKGPIPYGDHAPAVDRRHDINGRMSIAAVLYDLAGRKREADYFTRMTIMSHATRESGHTGHFFAWQWGAVGAARGGPEAAQAFCKSTRYWTELSRRHDGSSRYQPMMKGDPMKTGNWSTRGARLVQYCLSRKAIYITGKGTSVVTPIVGDELNILMKAGDFDAEKASDDDLIKALSNYSPVVRQDAAKEIGKRDNH